MTFAEEFRAARLKADLGLKETAKMLRRSVNMLVNLEAGKSVSARSMTRARDILVKLQAISKTK